MSDIFISYAREDLEVAGALAGVMEQRGWSVWWDHHLEPGRPFSRSIEEQLDAARCVVVLWSHHSVASEWVLAEAEEGAERQVLLPIRIDDVRLPLRFRRLHTADLSAWQPGAYTAELEQCVARIAVMIGSGSSAPSVRAPLKPRSSQVGTAAYALKLAMELVGIAGIWTAFWFAVMAFRYWNTFNATLFLTDLTTVGVAVANQWNYWAGLLITAIIQTVRLYRRL